MAEKPVHSDEKIILAIENANGNKTKAAAALGIHTRTIERRIRAMKSSGALTREPQIDGEIIRQSTLTGKDGEVVAQWDIRVPEKQLDSQKALIEGFAKDLITLPPRAILSEITRTGELANEFVFTDAHLGQMANAETSEQLEDQASRIVNAFQHLIANAPPAKTAIVNILGDWFHFDNLLPLTPRSANVLFANGNYRDMVEIGVAVMRKLIDMALMSHDHVEVIICEGNHDQASAQWLKIMMMALYEAEPRLRIADSETPFYAIPFGDIFLGYHHGHIKGLKDTKDLALYFAAEFRPMWGETVHTFLNTGHLHHIHEKEEHGVMIKQHPTLASKDHHSHQHGYRSLQAATCTTFHRIYGEVAKTRVTKEMLL